MPAGRPKGTTGTVFTDEHRQKIAGGNRGKTLPQEQIEKIRAGQLAYRARVRAIIKAAEEAGITPEDN